MNIIPKSSYNRNDWLICTSLQASEGCVARLLRHFIPLNDNTHYWIWVMHMLLIFTLISLFAYIGTTYGADWQHYDEDAEGNFLYVDKDSITEIKGITFVWQKKVYSNPNLFRIREVLGERYAKLIEKITLFEIYCPTRLSQERAYAYYDSNGKCIHSHYEEFVRDWKKIVSGTDMVLLYKMSCMKEEKK